MWVVGWGRPTNTPMRRWSRFWSAIKTIYRISFHSVTCEVLKKCFRREVSYDEGEELAKANGLEFLESSAKTGLNVEKVFQKLTEKLLLKIENGEIDPKNEVWRDFPFFFLCLFFNRTTESKWGITNRRRGRCSRSGTLRKRRRDSVACLFSFKCFQCLIEIFETKKNPLACLLINFLYYFL